MVGSVGLGSCGSVAAVEGRGARMDPRAGGKELEESDSAGGVVLEVGTAAPGGGGCEAGARTAPVDGGGFFGPRRTANRL